MGEIQTNNGCIVCRGVRTRLQFKVPSRLRLERNNEFLRYSNPSKCGYCRHCFRWACFCMALHMIQHTTFSIFLQCGQPLIVHNANGVDNNLKISGKLRIFYWFGSSQLLAKNFKKCKKAWLRSDIYCMLSRKKIANE